MNLNDRDWAEFKVSDLFNVKYGVNLELNACTESDKTEIDSVNFVARTAENNGISARVKIIEGVEPQKKGLISVAGGGSVLSTFLQNEPFYSGRDLYTLDSKDDISDEAKMFIITIIEKNKYKYSYGRQANKTLPDLLLKLPINDEGKPDYQFMEDYIKSLHHKSLTTKNKSGQAPALNVQNWKEFYLRDLFPDICNCVSHDLGNLEDGTVAFIGRTAENNGLQGFVDVPEEDINDGECISLSRVASNVALWQPTPFTTSQHITTFRCPELNIYRGMFICTVMNKYMDGRFSYGRTIGEKDITDFTIKLPVDANGNPDWQFMENYIKALPYGDRLEG